MTESTNAFGVPEEDIDVCIYCEGQVVSGELDDLELCPECQNLGLLECAGCGYSFLMEDMIGDECKHCV